MSEILSSGMFNSKLTSSMKLKQLPMTKCSFFHTMTSSFVSTVKAIEDPVQYYAEKLFTSFGGLGTNEDNVVRIIISRSEVFL